MYKTSFGKNKYGAKKTVVNGRQFDSKFEAGGAQELELRKRAGEILDYDCQYRVIIEIFNSFGKKVHEVGHKVDFRVHNLDGSFTLLEYKGFETQDYKFRRKLLEKIWLPDHKDHTYEVVYQGRR